MKLVGCGGEQDREREERGDTIQLNELPGGIPLLAIFVLGPVDIYITLRRPQTAHIDFPRALPGNHPRRIIPVPPRPYTSWRTCQHLFSPDVKERKRQGIPCYGLEKKKKRSSAASLRRRNWIISCAHTITCRKTHSRWSKARWARISAFRTSWEVVMSLYGNRYASQIVLI